jgi:hypothetical protein
MWQPVSTLQTGHHQTMTQEYACIQKLNTIDNTDNQLDTMIIIY